MSGLAPARGHFDFRRPNFGPPGRGGAGGHHRCHGRLIIYTDYLYIHCKGGTVIQEIFDVGIVDRGSMVCHTKEELFEDYFKNTYYESKKQSCIFSGPPDLTGRRPPPSHP